MTSVPAAAPDWPNVADEVHCPLCGYDLRGLVEPRCPECGYAFDWAGLIRTQRTVHPYLFEHHPERNVRSLVRTCVGTLLPRRFWRTLTPLHPVRPVRLAVYWALVVILTLVPVALNVALTARSYWLGQNANRASMVMMLKTRASPAVLRQLVRDFGSIQGYIDRILPRPTLASVLDQATRRQRPAYWALGAGLAWPGVMALVLGVYRRSTRQAKVRPAQVLRCTVYSADVIVWTGLLGVGLQGYMLLVQVTRALPPLPTYVLRQMYAPGLQLLLLAVAAAVATYRLTTAYALYLRMRRAWLAIPLAQMIVLLIYCQLFVLIVGV